MALDTSAQNLYEEAEQAIKFRKKHTKMSEPTIDQFVGENWQEGRAPAIPSHENHAFDTFVNLITVLNYSNPKVRIGSRRPVVHRQVAQGLTHAENRLIRDTRFSETMAPVAQDTIFNFGIVLKVLEPLPGHEDKDAPPLRPVNKRISPFRYFCDYRYPGQRFEGHEWTRDLEDLRSAEEADPADPTGKTKRKIYNQAVLEMATLDDDELDGLKGGAAGSDPRRLPAGINPVPRSQVRGMEIYVPEKGMIYTLTYYRIRGTGKTEAAFLRPPRKFFGPPWGPYYKFGLYAVPDQIYPLPPNAVTAGLVEEMNAHIDQLSEQADGMRQFIVMNGTGSANDKAYQAVKTAANGDVLAIPGFSIDQFTVATIGGPSKEGMDYVERLRIRLDRKGHTSDFDRGQVTGDATATENNLAAGAIDRHRKFISKQWRQQVQKVLLGDVWYLCNSKNVVFDMPVPKGFFESGAGPDQAMRSIEMEDGLFLGGPQEGEDLDFNDLELEIDEMSMELTDEALYRQQLDEMFQMAISWGPAMMQFPFYNWPAIFDAQFESRNIKDGRRFVNFDMLQQMVQMQFAAGQPQEVDGVDGKPMPDFKALAQGGKPNQRGASPGGVPGSGGPSPEPAGPGGAGSPGGFKTAKMGAMMGAAA